MHGRNLLYYVQKIKASKLHEMQLCCASALMLMFTNATYIIQGLVIYPVVGSVVATFSVTFLQCHLMR